MPSRTIDSYPTAEARCSALCAPHVTAAETATCQRAKATSDLTERYGDSVFYVCRLEKKK
jgi:hypothetical protein